MIIVMKEDTPALEIERMVKSLEDRGFQIDKSTGSRKVVLGLVGDTSALDERDFMGHEWVDRVMRVQEPYKRASRAFHPEDTIVDVSASRSAERSSSSWQDRARLKRPIRSTALPKK